MPGTRLAPGAQRGRGAVVLTSLMELEIAGSNPARALQWLLRAETAPVLVPHEVAAGSSPARSLGLR